MGRKPASEAKVDATKRKQFNYTLDVGLVALFNAHCSDGGLVRDRMMERAMKLFLASQRSDQTKTFVVDLTDDAAAVLFDYRELRDVDLSRVTGKALVELIDRDLSYAEMKRASHAKEDSKKSESN